MLETYGNDMGVMNQIARRPGLTNYGFEHLEVLVRLCKQHERRRGKQTPQILKRRAHGDWRMKHARVSDDAEELVNACPGNSPRRHTFSQTPQEFVRLPVVGARRDLGVNQNISVNSLHSSATVHKVEQHLAVEDIHSRELGGLPSAQTKPIRLSLRRNERLTKQVIGHRLQGPALFRRLLFQPEQEVVVNRQSGPPHAQKSIDNASRCQCGSRPGSA